MGGKTYPASKCPRGKRAKLRHPTYGDAVEHAERLRDASPLCDFDVYLCEFCGSWHVGKTADRRSAALTPREG